MMTATYSPDDNKLRLYTSTRLDKETYDRVKAAGFKWAPKQELFVAPMWTPEREDLLIELAGEVGDEDTSLVERAEQRAERFGEYSENRAQDANQARQAVAAIADGIPFGQPILVGHHSEKHARKDAERIENGMRRAVKMWEQSEYWTHRAKGSIRAAKYKELPAVRARRIKTIEAEKRKIERHLKQGQLCLRFWNGEAKSKAGGLLEVTYEHAKAFANQYDHIYQSFTLAEFPRSLPASQYEGPVSLWSALGGTDGPDHAIVSVEQAKALAIGIHSRSVERWGRWIAHYENRLTYERALLAEGGGTAADQVKPEVGGAVRCWASPGYGKGWAIIQKVNQVSVSILDAVAFGGKVYRVTMSFDKLKAVMSKAQVEQARAEGRAVESSCKCGFYLTTDAPEPKPQAPEPANDFDAMRDSLKAGVQVVTANQLFPTPPEVAKKVVELASVLPSHRILEPSAGTGNLLLAVHESIPISHWPSMDIVAIEINRELAKRLEQYTDNVRCADFLSLNGELGLFDRVLMNPPFENGSDIKHIQHALTHLKEGGRLVAICANGPRQREALEPLATSWIDLPEGTFKEQGTNVNTAIVVIDK